MKSRNVLKAIALFVVLAAHTAAAQKKRAVIFAIGNYPAESGWTPISSVNDATLLKTALEGQGFTDIKIIKDDSASMKGISEALERLIRVSAPGDIDFIHFSSHGEQVEDYKKHKADGLEECIVSFDARLPPKDVQPTREQVEKLLPGYYREDLLGRYIEILRRKLGKGGDLLVSLDLCHAGIGTRGVSKVRGGVTPLVSETFDKRKLFTGDEKDTSAFDVHGRILSGDPELSPYTVIGAARPNELDREIFDENGNECGSLSYALCKALLNLQREKSAGITYRALFYEVESIMIQNTLQHPVLTGTGKDRKLFGGSFVMQRPYKEVSRIEGNILYIKGGKLEGLDSGAKVALFKAGTINPAKEPGKFIDNGTIVYSSLYTAAVISKKSPGIKAAADCWVFVTSPFFKRVVINVGIESRIGRPDDTTRGFLENETTLIEKSIKTLPNAALSFRPDLKLVKGRLADSLIVAANGLLFDTLKSAADTASLNRKVKRYAEYSFLRSVNLRDTGALVEIKLLPIVNGKADSAKILAADNVASFKNGSKFKLWINNRSGKDLYINILDMQPDGQINPVIPNQARKISAEELLFPAGRAMIYENAITVAPPYGREIFKIFVSEDLIDMEEIAINSGSTSRGNLKSLERLLQQSYTGFAGEPVVWDEAQGSAFNLIFDIIPNN